jgi:microsomal dipeptidase-like Zn-dependent dipeptidase
VRRWLARLLGALALLGTLGALFAPGLVQADLNRTDRSGARPPSEAARRLHASLRVADLHADALLWGADLARRQARGHVDLPRLRAGNVAVQGFSVVTRSPRGLNYERNEEGAPDDITLLALAQLWPPRTWTSLLQRALHQAGRLRELERRVPGGAFRVLRSRADLDVFLEARRSQPALVAGFLAIEGAHALDGDPANVDALFAAGFRMMSPSHFFDNAMGGSAHGVAKGGLTPAGRDMLRRMEALGMALDLAHASPATFTDALAASTRPVFVSHTGVRATCPGVRNLTDDELRAVAGKGGVVGIGFWDSAVCGRDAAAVARAIRHAVAVAGAEHVAFGSDWDGAVTTPFDAAALAELTGALLDSGLSEAEIRQVAGENVLRTLRATLPAGPGPA